MALRIILWYRYLLTLKNGIQNLYIYGCLETDGGSWYITKLIPLVQNIQQSSSQRNMLQIQSRPSIKYRYIYYYPHTTFPSISHKIYPNFKYIHQINHQFMAYKTQL